MGRTQEKGPEAGEQRLEIDASKGKEMLNERERERERRWGKKIPGFQMFIVGSAGVISLGLRTPFVREYFILVRFVPFMLEK